MATSRVSRAAITTVRAARYRSWIPALSRSADSQSASSGGGFYVPRSSVPFGFGFRRGFSTAASSDQIKNSVMTWEEIVDAVRGSQRVTDENFEDKYEAFEKYGSDLTELARCGKLDPIISCDDEIKRCIQILFNKKKNPIIIGEFGVQIAAIVERLAQWIIQGDVPKPLLNSRLISLDMGSLIASGKFHGDLQERMKAVIKEVTGSNGQIILFIDEIHTVFGGGSSGGALDAANMLKAMLGRGELRCIGATTLNEYSKYIEKDSALESRFQKVFCGHPSIEDTIFMLRGLREKYEIYHRIKIADSALVSAAILADRYITDRFLPNKAVELVDHSAATLKRKIHEAAKLSLEHDTERLSKQKELTDFDIAETVSKQTGIPVSNLQQSEKDKLLCMEQILQKRVVGQEIAVQLVADAIKRSRVGLSHRNRPIASFIFMGPIGVGKTELAKALAAYFFNDEKALIRMNMSMYGEKQEVSRLVGAPPEYIGFEEGGELIEKVRKNPYCVILFEEIQKAHPDIYKILLPVLDEGWITDSQGRAVNFTNTVVIFKWNIMRTEEMFDLLKDTLKPEFINRIDKNIIFNPLDFKTTSNIVELQMNDVIDRLKLKQINLNFTEEAVKLLAKLSYNRVRKFGACSVKRVIQKFVENEIANKILRREIKEEDTVTVDADGHKTLISWKINNKEFGK